MLLLYQILLNILRNVNYIKSTRHNLKSNAIIERMNLAMLNMLHTLELSDCMYNDEHRV